LPPGRRALAHAARALEEIFSARGPADRVLSAYLRRHRALGARERAQVADLVYTVLRRRRTLTLAAESGAPQALVRAALVRLFGVSARGLEGEAARTAARLRAADLAGVPLAVRAELPDWLWLRLAAAHGAEEAMRIARGLLEPAPLDLRVNLARIAREEVIAALGPGAEPTPWSPAGVRLPGRPAIRNHALYRAGLVEVQDEASQLVAWLVAPRRGERVADFCAGAGGKTLALAMLMRGTGRVYAMDVSAVRLRELGPRLARAGVSNVHPIALSGASDPRLTRLAESFDRVLVDAPCSGTGTLRRNPDLKWRYGQEDVARLCATQSEILRAAARLVRPGGRLVYATCSLLEEENDAVVDAFAAAHPEFAERSCRAILAGQRIGLDTGMRLRLLPHRHGTDGFFAAVFERVRPGPVKLPTPQWTT